jgi:DNA-binding IclR family transcriptional regulator
VLEGLGLAKSSARSALVALQASALVEREGDRYALTDPLFEEWIAGLRDTGEHGSDGP